MRQVAMIEERGERKWKMENECNIKFIKKGENYGEL